MDRFIEETIIEDKDKDGDNTSMEKIIAFQKEYGKKAYCAGKENT